ncbi:myosin-13 [Anopheles bellator]|uniref:myosin-13 n=1 Tax=Anopheles bellator TaxID=139047 RepID=UPI0026479C5F|nr:myosin-13 [Anopheles bellator]
MTAEHGESELTQLYENVRRNSDASFREYVLRELLIFFKESAYLNEESADLDLDKDVFANDVNNWTSEADNRSVDEILQEAELLIHQQPLFAKGGENVDSKSQTVLEVSCEELWSGLLEGLDITEQNDVTSLDRVDQTCVNRMQNNTCRTIYSTNNEFRNVELENQSSVLDVWPSTRMLTSTIKVKTRDYLGAEPMNNVQNQTTNIPRTCDKWTQPSPVHEALRLLENGTETCIVSKYRNLENELLNLTEQVKDSQERYHSLKIQYETLSQAHRTLRDHYSVKQDEYDKLEFDIQHLTKCADVLRSELKLARSDRNFALELQNLLQAELDDARIDKKRLQDCNEKGTKTIQDLQRQCREMERILMRKNPDSIYGLIVATKLTDGKTGSDVSRCLQEIPGCSKMQLDTDIKKLHHNTNSHGNLGDVQARFNSVQVKYETHIRDLEMQVLSLQQINSKLNERIIHQMEELASISSQAANSSALKNVVSNGTQTDCHIPLKLSKTRRSVMVQTENFVVKPLSIRQQQTRRVPSQNKEDAHLLATIGGMRVDLALKEKAMQRLTREVEECKKTIKKLQKKKEVLVMVDSGKSPVKVRKTVLGCVEANVEGSLLREGAQPKAKSIKMNHNGPQNVRKQIVSHG